MSGRVTFNSHDESGNPLVYVGMHRPSCPSTLCDSFTVGLVRERYGGDTRRAWLDGAFDKPLYRRPLSNLSSVPM